MALRLRRSQFMIKYFDNQNNEEQEVQAILNQLGSSAEEK